MQCTHSEVETSKYEITWFKTILYFLLFFYKTVDKKINQWWDLEN